MTPATAPRHAARLDRDPTRSTMLRKEYAGAHSRRWRWLKGAVRTSIESHDIFGLREDPATRPVVLQDDWRTDPATEKQLEFLASLLDIDKSRLPDDLDKGTASHFIDELEVSPRAGGPSRYASPDSNIAKIVRDSLDRLAGAEGARSAHRQLSRLRRQIRDAAEDGDWEEARSLAREFLETDGRFNFPSDPERIQAFSGWLTQAEDAGILEVARDESGEIVERAGWQQVYVNRAYRKGILQADQKMRREGADIGEDADPARVVQLPIHQRKLELLFTRNFEELDGITDVAAQQMRRELTEGLVRGENPRKIATRLNDRVDNVGVHRSRLLARTEIIRAHAESTLTRYEQFGIEGVAGKAELATAGDSRVCAICAGLEGQVFSVEEARGVIPLHPQCRCTWIPVVDTERLNARENRDGAQTFLRRLEKARQELWPTWSRPPQIGKAA